MSRTTDLPQRRTIITNNHKTQPKTEPATQHDEIQAANEIMKFQPDSHKPTTKQKIKKKADLGIPIRWGVRAIARRQTQPPRVDLGMSCVDLMGGGESC